VTKQPTTLEQSLSAQYKIFAPLQFKYHLKSSHQCSDPFKVNYQTVRCQKNQNNERQNKFVGGNPPAHRRQNSSPLCHVVIDSRELKPI
jgi:hypothetical protein